MRKAKFTENVCMRVWRKNYAVLIILPIILTAFEIFAEAVPLATDLPLIFDPGSRKYFVGDRTSFFLRTRENGDSLDKIEVALDDGDFENYRDAFNFKKEGKHRLRFRAKNHVNHWSPVQYLEIFVDLSAPRTEIKWFEKRMFRAGEKVYLGPGGGLTLNAQDNLSGVGRTEYSLDGKTFLPYEKPIRFEKKGAYTLSFRSHDRVGNVEAVQAQEIIYDDVAPTSELKVQGKGKELQIKHKTYLAISDSAGLDIEAKDEGVGVKQTWVSFDGGNWQPYLKTIFFLKEGPHQLSFLTEDNVGNKESARVATLYTVSEPPQTRAIPLGKLVNSGGISFATAGFRLKLDATDNAVGTERIEYKMGDEADFKTYDRPIEFKGTGLQTVNYRAVDRIGNVEPTRIFAVAIQVAPPETQFRSSLPLTTKENVLYSPIPNQFTLSVDSHPLAIEGTYYSLDGGPYKRYTGPLAISPTKKKMKLTYKSADLLGIAEAVKTVEIRGVDVLPQLDLYLTDEQKRERRLETQGGERKPSGR